MGFGGFAFGVFVVWFFCGWFALWFSGLVVFGFWFCVCFMILVSGFLACETCAERMLWWFWWSLLFAVCCLFLFSVGLV